MKRLKSVETDEYQLEVVQCDCGYHIGIDATFIDQVGDFTITCPSCGAIESTATVCPEHDTVTCSLCSEEAPIASAHMHQGKFIGECCWDDRLRTTE